MSERVVCVACGKTVSIEQATKLREGMFYGPNTYACNRCMIPPNKGGTPREPEGGVRR